MKLALFIFAFSVLGSQTVNGGPMSWREKIKNYKKPSTEELKKKLTEEQINVTQACGTERAFKNEYWNFKEEGIYVDAVSGEPLFSSKDKYDSGTGWPSFTKPLLSENLVEKEDRTLGVSRTEVKSKYADSHLGHVFPDGPGPAHTRYCMNSASLRFVAVKDMEKEGYGEFLKLFTAQEETATLAGGCFWGVEDLIQKIPGVIRTRVGYTGGSATGPTYEVVKTGKTGHAESIEVVFDPTKLSYENLLMHFFKLHDPTTLNQQGNDKGTQYRSAIFYHSAEQKKTAEKVKAEVNKSGKWKKEVVTDIVSATPFYEAETYHQKYLVKNPGGYTCHYYRD